MKRVWYIIQRFVFDVVSLVSRFLNATLFNGSTAQTLSARAYVEGLTDKKWKRIGRVINALFFWQENHIKTAWEAEVDRAKYTLQRLKSMG